MMNIITLISGMLMLAIVSKYSLLHLQMQAKAVWSDVSTIYQEYQKRLLIANGRV